MSDRADEVRARQVEALRRAFGPKVLEFFGDKRVVEIMLNSDGRLWVERLGAEMECVGTMTVTSAMAAIQTAAALVDEVVTHEKPILETELPNHGSEFGGARFEALIPPVTERPAFAIRKKAELIFSLEDYVNKGIMTEQQRGVIEQAVAERRNILIAGGTGCHDANALILMFDGSLKRAVDICPGDLLMGPDSTHRKVLALHSGQDEMVQITPKKGTSFIVNAGHVLSLLSTPRKKGEMRTIVNIPVRSWREQNEKFKHCHKLWRAEIEMPAQDVLITPYFLGILLGDGVLSGGCVGVSKPDKEIFDEVCSQAKLFGLQVNTVGRGTSIVHRLTHSTRGCHSQNRLIKILKEIGLYGLTSGEKFIPEPYKTGSRMQRLELLAGLLDADGHLSNPSGGYEYTSKSKRLCEDLQFVCRSLGFMAEIKQTKKQIKRSDGYFFEGVYYRMHISGHCDLIPCRIPRKIGKPRRQIKDQKVTGFAVHSLGVGKYYGFEVDGDHLYLDEQFFVHHNTGKTTLANAVLQAIARIDQHTRIVIIEDVRELQCEARNSIFLRTTDVIDQTALLRATMRLRPDRIVVGEVRDKSALALLKAWNTGHPGGVGTVHANDAAAALVRIGQLVQEANVPPAPELIAEAVNLVVSIKREQRGRRVDEIVRVNGFENGAYVLERV